MCLIIPSEKEDASSLAECILNKIKSNQWNPTQGCDIVMEKIAGFFPKLFLENINKKVSVSIPNPMDFKKYQT